MSAYSRPVLLLLSGFLLLTISIAVLNTLVPLWLSHASLPRWQVGLVSSFYFTRNLAGTLLVGLLMKLLGLTRSIMRPACCSRWRARGLGWRTGLLAGWSCTFWPAWPAR